MCNGGVAVVIAVEEVTEHRQGTVVVDDGGNTDLNQFDIVGAMAIGEVRGRKEGGGGRGWQRQILRSRLRRLVGAVEEDMGGIKVETLGCQFGQAQGLLGDAGLDGVALVEEGVEGASEAVVVEFVGRDVPEDIGAGFFGPGGDVDEGRGTGQPSGQQKTEDSTMGELEPAGREADGDQ